MFLITVIILLVVGFVLFVFKGITKEPLNYSQPVSTYSPIKKVNLNPQEEQMRDLINTYRKSKGLNEVVVEVLASQVCQEAILEDLELGEEPNHYKWEERIRKCQCTGGGEIIAKHFTNPLSAFTAYLKSTKGHREAIENPSRTHIGISYINNINYCIFTQYT